MVEFTEAFLTSAASQQAKAIKVDPGTESMSIWGRLWKNVWHGGVYTEEEVRQGMFDAGWLNEQGKYTKKAEPIAGLLPHLPELYDPESKLIRAKSDIYPYVPVIASTGETLSRIKEGKGGADILGMIKWAAILGGIGLIGYVVVKKI